MLVIKNIGELIAFDHTAHSVGLEMTSHHPTSRGLSAGSSRTGNPLDPADKPRDVEDFLESGGASCKGQNELGSISQAAMLIDGAYVKWIGREADLPPEKTTEIIDARGCVVLPGLIDCHSHLIFAGERSAEFARRMNGETYEQIMSKGGGIMNTVAATSAASDEELLQLASARADAMLAKGTTTLEVKSGYGLSTSAEIRILRLVKKLNEQHTLDLHPTFLGAHVVPPNCKNQPERYVEEIINTMLPQVASEKLAIDCDVFCETGAFTFANAKKILAKAHDLGLGLRAHVQQLSPHSGGVKLVGELPLKSISHADFLSDDDIKLLANHHTIVEALPIAALFLRSKKITPVSTLTKAGVKLAIATDFNPGSAMCNDLILAARLAVTYLGFTIPDAVRGITSHAAQSLGRSDIGHLIPGARADVVITNCKNVAEIFYDWTKHPAAAVIKNGVRCQG